jgi:hypothetical protein
MDSPLAVKTLLAINSAMPKPQPKPAPPLLVENVLAWADAHRRRTGAWPNAFSGRVVGAPRGENWRKIDNALRYGLRGLLEKLSLAKLLARDRGHRNCMDLPRLTVALILRWADAYRKRTGTWPLIESGRIPESPGRDTWKDIDLALRIGARGLRRGRSLPQLLARRRRVRNLPGTPALSVEQILAWADEQHRRSGRWPSVESGAVAGHPDETWIGVNSALRLGLRGLVGGQSLAGVLRTRKRRTTNGERGSPAS